MVVKHDSPSRKIRDWFHPSHNSEAVRWRKPLLTVLAVILLASIFCLLLCGRTKAAERAAESSDVETTVSDDVSPDVDRGSPLSGDPVLILSADLSPLPGTLCSDDALSQDSPLPEICPGKALSQDEGPSQAVSADFPGEPGMEAFSSGDVFLRELLSPVSASSGDVPAGSAGTEPVSIDVVSRDSLPGRPASDDEVPSSRDFGDEVLSPDSGAGEGDSSFDEKRASRPPMREKAPPADRFGAITGNLVNFRDEPTVSSKVLGKLGKGERVRILKEWAPPSEGEAVLTRSCEIEVGGETIRLPNGFGVRVTAVHAGDDAVEVSFRHGDEWVSAVLAGDAVSSTVGDPWFLVQREDGRLGWAYGRYVETDPRRREGPGPEVQALYRKGVELLEAGKSGEALFALDQALELYPGHVDALFARGRCLASMKRYEEAVETFWEIPFYAPGQPQYLPWTGYCWQATGRYDRALLAYGAALKLHPDHEIARAVSEHAARCREALGLPAEALPSDEEIRAFLFDRWDDHIAEDIWQGSLRGKGLWDTW